MDHNCIHSLLPRTMLPGTKIDWLITFGVTYASKVRMTGWWSNEVPVPGTLVDYWY